MEGAVLSKLVSCKIKRMFGISAYQLKERLGCKKSSHAKDDADKIACTFVRAPAHFKRRCPQKNHVRPEIK
jgi:hypothetical protein